jgi:hypothetical protein
MVIKPLKDITKKNKKNEILNNNAYLKLDNETSHIK